MPDLDTKKKIQSAIQHFTGEDLTAQSLALFNALGYNTKRQAPLDQKTYKGFKDAYLDGNTSFSEEKSLASEWKKIDLLFQLSKEEVTTQHGLFDTKQVDRTIIETYLFFVIELSQENYSRTALSQIAREVNKVFPMPVMILFRYGASLTTVAMIDRELNKKDKSKDVLRKVTLIKDIDTRNPHRAHIDILFDLSFDELQRVHKFTNFVELHKAWQKTLDIRELNKKFYKELSNWYFWALGEVDFPGASHEADKKSLFKEEGKEKEHHAKNVIRLLTRLLFVWFVKEKGLIPEELFDEKYIGNELLLNFKPKKEHRGSPATHSRYYRAVLQNLFFASLNQAMGKREFRKPGQHMNVTNLMRYEKYFKDPKKFIQLVEKVVPFMNGGLFECLDAPDLNKKGRQGGDVIVYLDGFSDRDDNTVSVPDYLFFGEDHVDLSDAYGEKTKEYKNVAVKGLINILKSYKFTIAENTPLEEEVALDPELLGQVFENLLASYNPETKTTARKQTGSFYTPREIVNYMVDESLFAYLKQKLENKGIKGKEDSLRDLISYFESPNSFNDQEIKLLIAAIDNCKILDPACGSGAFLMGVLHKLVHVLHKLDPKSGLWKQTQIEKAQVIDDTAIRDQLVTDIEEAFDNNELDYGRKLYLIENCIYGIDIQPIATQISKLRFFISLIVDQKANARKDNFGVRPLPNLETKFVAANTLIGIEKPKAQLAFGSIEIKALEDQLKDVRHRLFSAKTPVTKRKLREEDKVLRVKMGDLLIKSGWEDNTARQLAGWDPYDQNASSSFFDPDWMFGLTDGFNIVIGNPPYGAELSGLEIEYFKKIFRVKTSETAILFIEKGHGLLSSAGVESYIIPKAFTFASNYSAIRDLIEKEITIIGDCGKAFEEVKLEACVIQLIKGTTIADYNSVKFVEGREFQSICRIDKSLKKKFGSFPNGISGLEIEIGEKIINSGLFLNAVAMNSRGELLQKFIAESGKLKVVGGKEIDKYGIRGVKGFIDPKHAQSEKCQIHKNSVLAQNIIAHIMKPYDHIKIIACIPNASDCVLTDTVNQITIKDGQYSKELIWALLNSKLINWYMYFFIFGKAIRTMHFDNAVTDRIPIPKVNHREAIGAVVNFCMLEKEDSKRNFLEQLIDAAVYELYFSSDIKSAGCEVLRHLTDLPELKADWSDQKKLSVVEKVCQELSDSKHPVSIAMAKMQQIPEVMIIEGRDK